MSEAYKKNADSQRENADSPFSFLQMWDFMRDMRELSTEKFTKTLKRLRIAHGLTQEALAEKIEANASTVNRWESGVNAPGYKEFYKLMRAFNVSFEELSGAAPLSETQKRKATPEEALSVIAHELGIEMRIVHPYNPVGNIPKDISSKISRYKTDDKVWDLVRGVLNGIEKVDGSLSKEEQERINRSAT